MKITEKELRKLIREAIKKKMSVIKEDRDFDASRKIEQAAANASMEFEQEIISYLNLVRPDDLPDNVQMMYKEVVDEMKNNVITATKNAVEKLKRFPRNDGTEK